MDSRRCTAHLLALMTLGLASIAQAAPEPCFKNHFILDAPCAFDWTPVNTGLTHLDVRVVSVDPVDTATVYAGGLHGLFRSRDGGASWSITGLAMKGELVGPEFGAPFSFAYSAVSHLVIDARNPGTMYAATNAENACVYWQRRIFKSVDRGATWTDSVSPAINGCDGINSLVLAPSDPSTLYLSNFDGIGDGWSPIVRSTNGTSSWDYLGHPWLTSMAVDPVDSRTVYGGTYDYPPSNFLVPMPDYTLVNGLLKSVDGGSTWALAGIAGMGVAAVAVDPSNRQTIYAATFRLATSAEGSWVHRFAGLMKSVDGAATWSAMNSGIGHFIGTVTGIDAIVIDADDSDTLYIAMPGAGIMRSVDAGESWSPFNDGLADRFVASLALVAGSPNTLYAGTPSGVFKVTDVMPALTVDGAPRLCLGQTFNLKLRRGPPNAAMTLIGSSDGQPWGIEDWSRTDANGSFTESGPLVWKSEGSHTLRIQAGASLSNSVSFVVANCRPEGD